MIEGKKGENKEGIVRRYDPKDYGLIFIRTYAFFFYTSAFLSCMYCATCFISFLWPLKSTTNISACYRSSGLTKLVLMPQTIIPTYNGGNSLIAKALIGPVGSIPFDQNLFAILHFKIQRASLCVFSLLTR